MEAYVNLYENGAANAAWYRTEEEAKANILVNLPYMGTFQVIKPDELADMISEINQFYRETARLEALLQRD